MAEKEFPGRVDLLSLIPDPENLDITNFKDGGVITTDTCATALKVTRLLTDKIGGTTYTLPCMHHLRCIWINGVLKAIDSYLRNLLKQSLDEIEFNLCVTYDLSTIIRAYHKEFSLLCNYPKGHGEVYFGWVKENYPEFYLFRAERANGSRQDLVAMGSLAIYWNRRVNLEFLRERLASPHTNSERNILQSNLYITLGSLEVVATARFFAIIHLAVVVPVRWLSAK